jgi:hypothetical protein
LFPTQGNIRNHDQPYAKLYPAKAGRSRYRVKARSSAVKLGATRICRRSTSLVSRLRIWMVPESVSSALVGRRLQRGTAPGPKGPFSLQSVACDVRPSAVVPARREQTDASSIPFKCIPAKCRRVRLHCHQDTCALLFLTCTALNVHLLRTCGTQDTGSWVFPCLHNTIAADGNGKASLTFSTSVYYSCGSNKSKMGQQTSPWAMDIGTSPFTWMGVPLFTAKVNVRYIDQCLRETLPSKGQTFTLPSQSTLLCCQTGCHPGLQTLNKSCLATADLDGPRGRQFCWYRAALARERRASIVLLTG